MVLCYKYLLCHVLNVFHIYQSEFLHCHFDLYKHIRLIVLNSKEAIFSISDIELLYLTLIHYVRDVSDAVILFDKR